MVRNIVLQLSILCSVLCLQNCVHGTLDDCPPMVRYAVAFEYTLHTGTTDRFYDDVKKINLYVFDEQNLVYTTVTELSPYEKNFNIPLDLPMGKYNIIAWGNALADQPFSITPTTFVKGQTTLAEARLLLQREAGNLSRREMEKLFFGELLDVEIPLYVSRIDTIPLVNDTKWVRIVIHWDHTGEAFAIQNVINYDDVYVRMEASNAVYNFHNQFTQTNNVVYRPYAYYYSGSILSTDERKPEIPAYYWQEKVISEISNTCVYDFNILRMIPGNNLGSPIYLVLDRQRRLMPDPVNLTTINIIQSFSDYFDKDGYTVHKQPLFDKYDYYRIDLYFTYDKLAGEYVTGSFHVLDWHETDQGYRPGAD